MLKRRRFYFVLAVLILLWAPSLLSTVGTIDLQEYDFSDNNTSNVDGVADIGTHSNFTAQRYGPDSIYDSLTEESAAVGGIIYENSAESNSTIGASSHNFNYPLQKSSGNERLVVVTVSWEDQQTGYCTSCMFDGVEMTKVDDVQVDTGDSWSEYIGLFYLLDSSLPSSAGDYEVNCTASEGISRQIYMAIAEYSGVGQLAPDDYDTDANPSAGDTAITLTSAVNGSVVVAGVGEGGTNAFTNTNNINNLQEEILASSGSALGHHTNVNAGNITVGWNNLGTREGMVGAVWQPASSFNFELDLEVQWTNASYTQAHEELCIFGGNMGLEDIRVDVWSGSTWHNLFTDLSSGWNNVSVTGYLVSSTFTIKFSGGAETGDPLQDSWEIDCTLLHTWETPPIASFTHTPDTPYTSETMTFNASESSDPDGAIVAYFWDFGDGTNITGEIANHGFQDDGTYTVTLTVTDDDSLQDSTSTNITVLNRSPVAIYSLHRGADHL
jgi:PKD repeat protein